MKRALQTGWAVSLYGGRLLFGPPPREDEDMEYLGEEQQGVTLFVLMQERVPFVLDNVDHVAFELVPEDLNCRSEAKQIEWYTGAAERVAELLKEAPERVIYLCNVTGMNEEATVAFLAWALLDPAHCPRDLTQWLTDEHRIMVLDNEDARRLTQGTMARLLNTNGRTITSYFKKAK